MDARTIEAAAKAQFKCDDRAAAWGTVTAAVRQEYRDDAKVVLEAAETAEAAGSGFYMFRFEDIDTGEIREQLVEAISEDEAIHKQLRLKQWREAVAEKAGHRLRIQARPVQSSSEAEKERLVKEATRFQAERDDALAKLNTCEHCDRKSALVLAPFRPVSP